MHINRHKHAASTSIRKTFMAFIIFITLISSVYFFTTQITKVRADQKFSWISDITPSLGADERYEFTGDLSAGHGADLTVPCTDEAYVSDSWSESEPVICLIQGDDVEMTGPSTYTQLYGMKDSIHKYKINKPYERTRDQYSLTLVPFTNTVLTSKAVPSQPDNVSTQPKIVKDGLTITEDIRDNLAPIRSATGQITSYNFSNLNDITLSNQKGPLPASIVALSNNGKWLFATIDDGELVRINIDTYEVNRFTTYRKPTGTHLTAAAISNDGQYIATAIETDSDETAYETLTFYEITDSCGDVSSFSYVNTDTPVTNPCNEPL